ncbi:hypothetical protein MASR2M79_06910 [Aminivibrio sp.]
MKWEGKGAALSEGILLPWRIDFLQGPFFFSRRMERIQGALLQFFREATFLRLEKEEVFPYIDPS